MLYLISLLGNYVEIVVSSVKQDTYETDASNTDFKIFLFNALNQILRSINFKRKSNFISH